jgi:teichuronic acid biosynthesis glycosyltransferase TuaG
MKNNELVSIITPSYNSAKFIIQSIESVISQTYSNWEMIIVDDCSQDNSIKIIKEFQEKNNRIKLIESKVNQRPARARNRAIKYANGRYIAFLDSDDVWKTEKLTTQIDFMQFNDISFSFSSYHPMSENGMEFFREIKAPLKIDYNSFLKNTIIGCLTVVLDKDKIGDVKMPKLRTSQDMALWLSIMKGGVAAYGIEKSLAYYRIVGNSNTSNKFKVFQGVWRIYRIEEGLGYVRSIWYFLNYAFNAIKKRI